MGLAVELRVRRRAGLVGVDVEGAEAHGRTHRPGDGLLRAGPQLLAAVRGGHCQGQRRRDDRERRVGVVRGALLRGAVAVDEVQLVVASERLRHGPGEAVGGLRRVDGDGACVERVAALRGAHRLKVEGAHAQGGVVDGPRGLRLGAEDEALAAVRGRDAERRGDDREERVGGVARDLGGAVVVDDAQLVVGAQGFRHRPGEAVAGLARLGGDGACVELRVRRRAGLVGVDVEGAEGERRGQRPGDVRVRPHDEVLAAVRGAHGELRRDDREGRVGVVRVDDLTLRIVVDDARPPVRRTRLRHRPGEAVAGLPRLGGDGAFVELGRALGRAPDVDVEGADAKGLAERPGDAPLRVQADVLTAVRGGHPERRDRLVRR